MYSIGGRLYELHADGRDNYVEEMFDHMMKCIIAMPKEDLKILK
jgi:hypothetical protein